MHELTTLRIMVADDHESVREGLCSLLTSAPGVEVVASVGDIKSALSSIPRTSPDVVVLDFSMPRLTLTGLRGSALSRNNGPQPRS